MAEGRVRGVPKMHRVSLEIGITCSPVAAPRETDWPDTLFWTKAGFEVWLAHGMKRIVLSLMAGLWLALGAGAQAVVINTFKTGVDESNGDALLADNVADSNWIITSITGGADGTVPRAATTINPVTSGWTAPIAGTRSITRGTSSGGEKGATYTYRYQFTLDTSAFTDFGLSGLVWADNQVRVLLNGNQILAQTGNIRSSPAVSFSTINQSYFQNGINSMTFEVLNTTEDSTGLNVSGTVTATAVPEAHEWAMMFAATGMIVWRRRREVMDFKSRLWGGSLGV